MCSRQILWGLKKQWIWVLRPPDSSSWVYGYAYAYMCVFALGMHVLWYKYVSVQVCVTLHTHKARICDVFPSHLTVLP